MTSSSESVLSLRIWHDTLDPTQIESAIGLAAEIKVAAGARRHNARGAPVGPPFDRTYCVFPVACASELDFNPALRSHAAPLSVALAKLATTGATVEYYATFGPHIGMVVEPQTLQILSASGAQFGFDWVTSDGEGQ